MINDELISAYLDGELTAEEQAQVEQALAGDARLRHMHDDLRVLRGSLQALPAQQLDAGFAARVVRAARQAQRAAHAEPEVLLKTHHGRETAVTPAQHEPMAWRVMVWSIAGLAASLLIMLLLPQRTSDLAQRFPKQQSPIAQVATGQGETSRQEGTTTLSEATPQPEASRVRGQADVLSEELSKQLAQPSSAPAAPAIPGENQVRSFGATPGTAPAPPTNADKPADGVRFRESERHGLGGSQADEALKKTVDVEAGEQLLVVRLRMSHTDVQQQAIDGVLAEQGIHLQQQRPLRRDVAKDKSADVRAKLQEKADVAESGLAEVRREEVRKELAEQILPARADLVYVEASPEQVQATIDNLTARPDARLSLPLSTFDDMKRNRQLSASENEDRAVGNARHSKLFHAAPAAAQEQSAAGTVAPGARGDEGAGAGRRFAPPSVNQQRTRGVDDADGEQAPSVALPFATRLDLPGNKQAETFHRSATPLERSVDSRDAESQDKTEQPPGKKAAPPRSAAADAKRANALSAQRVRVLFILEAHEPDEVLEASPAAPE